MTHGIMPFSLMRSLNEDCDQRKVKTDHFWYFVAIGGFPLSAEKALRGL
jgi:hypothetical protein